MKNLYNVLFASLAFMSLSCETDSVEVASGDLARTAAPDGQSLRISNQSDLDISGELICYGAENNMAPSSSIRIMGKISIPAHSNVTHRNFHQTSDPSFRINPWYVSYNAGPMEAYGATQVNNTFGQFLIPGVSPVKFANWRYLKVRLSYSEIPNFQPVTMVIELPQYSPNNTGGQLVDLSPYGLEEDLYISQTSYLGTNGNTVLTINSELVN